MKTQNRYVIVYLFVCLIGVCGCTVDVTDLESLARSQVLVTATNSKTCFKRPDEAPVCFGRLLDGPTPLSYENPLDKEEIVELHSGYSHKCVVTASENVYCWGADNSGSLGAGMTLGSDALVPVKLKMIGSLSGKRIASLAASRTSTCALDTDGGISCWGSNAYGQLGTGTTASSAVPVAVDTSGVLNGKKIAKLVTNKALTMCALDEEGAAYCWGNNSKGQLGDGSSVTKSYVPVAVDMSGVLAGKRIVDLALGEDHACAIADDSKVYCWGTNASGALGVKKSSSTLASASTPQEVYVGGVLSGKQIVKIGAGKAMTCVLDSEGAPYCWGNGSSGQLGIGVTKSSSTEAVAVDTSGVLNGKDLKDISVGFYNSCVLDDQGRSFCWGSGAAGSLGNDDTTNQVGPVATVMTTLKSGEKFATLASGNDRVCGLSNKKNIYCWGNGGTIENGPARVPTYYGWDSSLFPDMELKYIRDMSMAEEHACYVSSSYRVFCVGKNLYGTLGTTAAAKEAAYPVPVDSSGVLKGKKIVKVKVAKNISYALSSEGQLYAWGYNYYGLLANGNTGGIATAPVVIDVGGEPVRDVVASEHHACALTYGKEIYCWGYNGYGQVLGAQGDFVTVPTKVGGALAEQKVKAISSNTTSTCVLTINDRPYCWGLNYGDVLPGGILGVNSNELMILEPTAVTWPAEFENVRFASLSSPYLATCALTAKGVAYCWGYNSEARTGTSGGDQVLQPTPVETNQTFTMLTAGENHVCGYSKDKDLYCWGSNSNGTLGNTLFVDPFSSEPLRVNGL